MQKRQTVADIQRNQLAVIGMNNVSVIDSRVNKLNNDYQSYIEVLEALGNDAPKFPSAIKGKLASAANVLALPGANVTEGVDKIVIISLPSSAKPINVVNSVAGFLVTEKYMQFKQGSVHTVDVIPYIDDVTPDLSNARSLTVDNTSGTNTVSEYTVLPTMQPVEIGSLVETVPLSGIGTLPIPARYERSAGNYLTPWPLRAYGTRIPFDSYIFVAIIFRGIADEAQISVTPIFGGLPAARSVAEIINK